MNLKENKIVNQNNDYNSNKCGTLYNNCHNV